jgi:hypothetical protein
MTMTEAPIPSARPAPAHEPAGYAPLGTTASRSPAPSVDQLAAMAQLTARMSEMGNDHDGRYRLANAVNDEIAAGGSGLLALGMDPSRMAAEAQHKAVTDDTGNAAPASATPAADYSALHPEAFGDQDERQAFGEAMSTAGLDVRVVQSLVADVAGDGRIHSAIGRGEAGIEARLVEVREFFAKQPSGMDDLKLAVAFGEHLVAKSPKLAATWDAAMLSENALFSLACEARRLRFRHP